MKIEEVIQDFIPLKKKGGGHTLWGCCPFHQEKTPSFAVQVAKGFYKCFGCGKAGDAIHFLQEKEGLSYLESMHYLAEKYNIPWEEEMLSDEAKEAYDQQEKHYIILEIVVAYYQEQLAKSVLATQYLQDRNMTDEQVNKFKLGYSQDAWRAIYDFASGKGYDDSLLAAVGLIIKKNDKVYDRFRGRLIFPLQDALGRVVGLAGRTLVPKPEQAKYINSPETTIYHKGRLLYGLFQAKASIKKNKFGYLVEGYTDVLALHKAGTENVVASGGTSLTQEQILLFKRYSNAMTLVFDGDQAGMQAALRSIDILLANGLDVKVVALPAGEDPDSFINQRGKESMQEYLVKNSENCLEFMVKNLLSNNQDNPTTTTQAMDTIISTIAKIGEPTKRGVYIQLASRLMGLSQLTIEESVRAVADSAKSYAKPVSINKKVDAKKEAARVAREEQALLHLLFNYGMTLMDDGRYLVDYFFTETADITFEVPQHQSLLDAYRKIYEGKKIITSKIFLTDLPQELVQTAAAIIADDQLQLSQGWETKHQIILTNVVEKVVGDMLHKKILRRKFKVVNRLLQDARVRIAQLNQQKQSDEATFSTHETLKKVQTQIGNELGLVSCTRSFLLS